MADAERTGPMFNGSFVAIITPFKGGAVDESAFRKLIDWHISEGTHGIIPCGTTGESPTLSHDEHMRVTEIAIEQAAKRGRPGEHIGLSIMEERARRLGGNLRIESEVGEGTRVELSYRSPPHEGTNDRRWIT